MRICSFYDGGRCIEYLDQHIDEAMNKYNEFFKSCGYIHTIHRRIKNIGINLRKGELESIIELSIIMHDFGKTVSYRNPSLKTLIPHEAISYIMSLSSLDHIGKYTGRDYAEAVPISILHHHVAMKRIKPLDFKHYIKYYRLNQQEINILEKILSKYGYNIKINESIEPNSLSSIIKYYGKHSTISLKPEPGIYDIVLRVLRVLVVSDNLAAMKTRGGSLRVFLRDLPACRDIEEYKKEVVGAINDA